MPLRALFFLQLSVIATLGLLHVGALYFSLYWHYVWLDTLSHFLGGGWIALAYGWVMLRLKGRAPSLLEMLAIIIVVGIGWEVFEITVGVPREANWTFDTAVDLLMDVFGGLVGIFFFKKLS